MTLSFNRYQEKAQATSIYGQSIEKLLEPIRDALYIPGDITHEDYDVQKQEAYDALEVVSRLLNLSYAVLGLTSEAGEVAGVLKKMIRDGIKDDSFEKLTKETGDCLWYEAAIASECGNDLSELAQGNLDKLADRAKRNEIGGSGDNR